MELHPMFLFLVGLPLLGSGLGWLWARLARREAMLGENDPWAEEREAGENEGGRFLVLSSILLTKPIYGLMEAFFLALNVGAFSGAADWGKLGGMTELAGLISAGVSCLVAVADGGILAAGMKGGALQKGKLFRRTLIRSVIIEAAALLGLLFFLLAAIGVCET